MTRTRPMWDTETEALSSTVIRMTLSAQGARMRFAQVMDAWRHSGAFRAFWTGVLQRVPFEAYCWELPPLTDASIGQSFECVCVDNPVLTVFDADPSPFAAYFQRQRGSDAVVFDNLGHDAVLVAPCPQSADDCYAHLATFARHAPRQQACALWQTVAQALEKRLGKTPVWVSTAGGGVYWLHVRLDDAPKYYRYRPYATYVSWSVP